MEKTAEQRLKDELEALISGKPTGFEAFVEKIANEQKDDADETEESAEDTSDDLDVEVERQETGTVLDASEVVKEAGIESFDFNDLVTSATTHFLRKCAEEGLDLPADTFLFVEKLAGTEALESLGTSQARNFAQTLESRKQSLMGRGRYNPIRAIQVARAGRRGMRRAEKFIGTAKLVNSAIDAATE